MFITEQPQCGLLQSRDCYKDWDRVCCLGENSSKHMWERKSGRPNTGALVSWWCFGCSELIHNGDPPKPWEPGDGITRHTGETLRHCLSTKVASLWFDFSSFQHWACVWQSSVYSPWEGPQAKAKGDVAARGEGVSLRGQASARENSCGQRGGGKRQQTASAQHVTELESPTWGMTRVAWKISRVLRPRHRQQT